MGVIMVSYDANTNMLQILKDDNAFPSISVQITAAPAAPQTLTAQVINSIDNDTYCDVYTPVLPIIVRPIPVLTTLPAGDQAVCDLTTAIVPVTFSWTGAVDSMRVTGFSGITHNVAAADRTDNGAGDITITGTTSVTFSGLIDAAQTITFRSTGPCGVNEVMTRYNIRLESPVRPPEDIRKTTNSPDNTVHTQGGKQIFNTVYVSTDDFTDPEKNEDWVEYWVCPNQAGSSNLMGYDWSIQPADALSGGVVYTGPAPNSSVRARFNWDQDWVTGLSGTGTTVTISVSSQSNCGATSAPLVTSIRLINVDSATLTNTIPNLLPPAVTTAKCGWRYDTLLALPSCAIFAPFGVAGAEVLTNQIQYFSAPATTTLNEYKEIEFDVPAGSIARGSGAIGNPTINSTTGVLVLPSGWHGTFAVKARAIGFDGELGNWSSTMQTVAPTSEIIPTITPTGLPDCPIPLTGTYSTTLTAGDEVQYFISSTSTLKTGTYSIVAGSFEPGGFMEIRGDATTSRTLDLTWKNGLTGNNTVFLVIRPLNCSRYSRNYIIKIPEDPDIYLVPAMSGFISQDICEDDTLLENPITFNIKGPSVTGIQVTQTAGPLMSGPLARLDALHGNRVIGLFSKTATITLNGANNVSQAYYYATINSTDVIYQSPAAQTVDNLGTQLANVIKGNGDILNCVYDAATNQLRVTGMPGIPYTILVTTPAAGGGITATQDANGPFEYKNVTLSSLTQSRPPGIYKFTLNTIHSPARTSFANPTWCVSDSYIFTLTVHPNSELTRQSLVATVNQNICFDDTFDDIVYSVTGNPTSIVATGLPFAKKELSRVLMLQEYQHQLIQYRK